MKLIGRIGLVLPLLFFLPVGCGKQSNVPSSLTGRVTYKGELIKGGSLAFYTKDEKGVYSADIGPSGTFTATDLPLGEYTVTINTEGLNPKNKKAPETYGKGKMAASPQPSTAQKGTQGEYTALPARFRDKKASGLTMTLTAGANTKNFELTD